MSETAAAPAEAAAEPSVADVLGSVHTSNFDLLRELHSTLIVSTYQAGKLVLLRPDGAVINTHFRLFRRPMGLHADRNRLVLGAHMEIIEFRNVPDVAARLQQPPRHDGVFCARDLHVTGAIDIHELALDGDGEVWFINTLFSCLCTLDGVSSFAPAWRPRFVSHYAPEDRCHLNGLAVRDGFPRYVTALGETNTPQGWRANKRDGGILIDLDSDEIITRGLSMPHSPRWYDNRLWVLESGRGALVTVDPSTGQRTDVARLPGFLRGLDFVGPVAFVGLLAAARDQCLHRHPDHRRQHRPAERGVGGAREDGPDARLPEVHRRRAGDLRRAGGARPAVSGGAARRRAAGPHLRPARGRPGRGRGAGRAAGGGLNRDRPADERRRGT